MRLHVTEQQIVQEVVRFLRNNLDDNYEIVSDYQAVPNERFDIALLRNRDIVALFEVKLSALWYGRNPIQYNNIYSRQRSSGAKYIVITDGDDYCVFSALGLLPTIVKGDDFVNCIMHDYPMSASEPDKSDLANAIVGFAKEFKLRSVEKYISSNVDHIVCDPKTATISFASGKYEDLFFRKLLPSKKIGGMCRYTTIESAFQLLKNKKQNMCNILCMNDKSEGIYADKKVFGYAPDSKEKAFAESDNCYIVSMMDSSMDDNLTMWRLYGDDAKGVCISYSRKNMSIKDFFLARISYGKLGKGREEHKELEFLSKIHKYNFGSGWRFVFNRWGIWKHFFKSYLFRDENEIRLLYLDNNDDRTSFEWIKNSKSQIVSKMQMFLSGEFPLEMQSIKIGPKLMESDMIRRQMQLLAQNQNINVRVGASGINIYR